MELRVPRRGRHFLAYEMNVHPGDSLAELRRALRRWTLPVRERLAPGRPFGIAPRVGRGLLADLATARARRELRAELADLGLIPVSVNAFPLENFHARRVKEQVYSPPWTGRTRGRLTERAAALLAELLPAGATATVSTLGGTYRPWGHGAAVHRKIGEQYLRVVRFLAELEQRTGRTVLLAAEPEPDTTFETAADVIALFEEHMLPRTSELLARPLGVRPDRAEEILRRFFTVNLDVCHQSVLFRDPVAEWRTLARHGLRVGKLHITSALRLPRPARSPAGRRALARHAEPRYLHQFAGRRRGADLVRGADLPDLEATDLTGVDELRVHFHVPLSRARLGPLATTRDDTARALRHALGRRPPPQLVIETYTWPQLLGRQASDQALIDGIVREFRWTIAQLGATAVE